MDRFHLFVAFLLVAIAAGGVLDLIFDRPERWLSSHVVAEAGLLLLSLGSAVVLWRGWYRARRSLERVRETLDHREVERDAWRERTHQLLRGLGEAIDSQLRAWSLTGAERETALLLLKGFSHKEIARLCGRSERTVRQHAVAVYRKSGLAGRAELSAFFLEDLLLPMDSGSPAPEEPRQG